MDTPHRYGTIVLALLLGIAAVGNGVLGGMLVRTRDAAEATATAQTREIDTLRTTVTERDLRVTELEALLAETKGLLERAIATQEDLRTNLEDEQDRNQEFEDQIEKISGTVGTLDKLAKTDPELLMKYSKVYFLNEHYMPESLRELPASILARPDGDPEFIHRSVYPFLDDLIDDAKDDGIDLLVLSAFRSFDEQRDLKSAYSVTYGSGANTFSADQGYSEHQLGTTVDFTTKELGGGLSGFDATPAYAWLLAHAHTYGFVLSYPKGNAYYIFEPWHWRFVGTELARDLYKSEKSFYDLDQREIDAYRISLFD